MDSDRYSLPLPKVIRIEPSSRCNLRCRHCTTGLKMNRSVGIMSRETFDRIFERIEALRFRALVLYHGGEPLLNRELFYFIEKLRPLTEFLKFSSNGMLLTEEAIERILRAPIDLIQFSLDGVSAEENDSIRLNSSFDKVAANITRLMERRKALGSKIQVYLANVQIPKPGNLTKIEIPPHLRDAFRGHLDEMTVRCYYPQYWPGLPGREGRPETAVKSDYCDHVVNTVTVRWNGDIVPCCYDLTSAMVLGNLVEEPLAAIWNNSRYRALRKAIAERNPPQMCRGCNELYPETFMFEEDLAQAVGC